MVGALTHMVQKLPSVRNILEEKDQIYGVALSHEGLLDLLELEGRRLLTNWLVEQKATGGKAFGAVGGEECLAWLFLGGCNRGSCGGYHGEEVKGCLKAFDSFGGKKVCWTMARTGKCADGAACKWGHTSDPACRTHGKPHTHPAPRPQGRHHRNCAGPSPNSNPRPRPGVEGRDVGGGRGEVRVWSEEGKGCEKSSEGRGGGSGERAGGR